MNKRLCAIVIFTLLAVSACGTVEESNEYVAAMTTNIPPETRQIVIDADSIYQIDYDQEIASPTSPEEPRLMIAIDPGHQSRGNYEREQNGPGSLNFNTKVATGTRGVYTGVPEYQLVLEVSLQLRDELIARGFDVFMIRETHDVNITNRERAVMASESGADIFLRIHANGSTSQNAHGIKVLTSTTNNPYIPHLYQESRALAEAVLCEMVTATGARNMGIMWSDNMTGNNWSTIPVIIVEMGFMTNPQEDELMQTPEYQRRLVLGMVRGVERYFGVGGCLGEDGVLGMDCWPFVF